MTHLQLNETEEIFIPERQIIKSENKNFIEANTKTVSLSHLKNDCTIPVFSKDNECTIAHQEFIEVVQDCAFSIFPGNEITKPEIRTSHIVKGRIPSAIGKPVKELQEHEKTIYYERMMFVIEIPTISQEINGNRLNLSLGGVRAYNQENLYSKKSFEKFKFFIGFQNKVCTNLCISSDGFVECLRVSSPEEMRKQLIDIIGNYSFQPHLEAMRKLTETSLSEKQFAQFLGKCRLYNFLPKEERESIPKILLNDGQINTIAKDYYEDKSFCRDSDGNINLWNMYSLLTGANKSSYIDSFLPRSVNAYEIAQSLGKSLQNKSPNWFL